MDSRFLHAPARARVGTRVEARGHTAIVEGLERLSGANVMATGLRASASLVMAALIAEGESVIQRVCHLDRGYETIERKLSAAGASVPRITLQGNTP